jgi:metal-responsive CopG/Arc/MetJ family transcriptional regulator
MAVEKISLSLPSDLISQIDSYAKRKNISRSAFFKDISKRWLLKKMDEDAIELSMVKYGDLPSEDDWLIVQNECDKYYD